LLSTHIRKRMYLQFSMKYYLQSPIFPFRYSRPNTTLLSSNASLQAVSDGNLSKFSFFLQDRRTRCSWSFVIGNAMRCLHR
jgi:hypothetical protein